jgi:hypothetical protein
MPLLMHSLECDDPPRAERSGVVVSVFGSRDV